MKFVLKTYDDIREKVETMSVRQLLRAVACPAANADDRNIEKDFAGVYIHPAIKNKSIALWNISMAAMRR